MTDILLVAATEPELCGHDGLVCGVGPVEAAAATARALAYGSPGALLHVGVAGARGIAPGSLVIGSEAVYCDISAAISVVSRQVADTRLVEAARRALSEASVLPIGTSAAVGGGTPEVAVEAMEGFGVLRAAALAGVPAVEVRAVSNELGELDRARWRLDEALASLARALPLLLAAAAADPRTR